jgi:hypothetical protein
VRQLSLPFEGSGDDASLSTQNDSRSVVVRLASESIEALALRLAELVSDGPCTERLIDASAVARRHGVSRAFVYEHADELGAIRVGIGPRPRLRFDRATVDERLAAGRDQRSQQANTRSEATRQPASGNSSGGRLLPIRGGKSHDPGRQRRPRAAKNRGRSGGRGAA